MSENSLSRRRFLRLGAGGLAVAAASGLLSACSTPPAPATPPPAATPTAANPTLAPLATTLAPAVASSTKIVRAAFVYTGPINDHGWTNAHEDGRKALQQALGPRVETAYTENVPETADAQGIFENYARKGFDVIYGTSFGYMEYMLAAATAFPDVRFDLCSGLKTAPNMATYDAAEEEPRYVSGMIAGKMTRTNTLGFVGSFPIPRVVRSLNAFAAGVQATNPAARIHMLWMSTWFDPPRERSGAEALLDLNADVLTGTATSPSLAQAAGARGKYAVGVDYDQSSYAPQAIVQSDRFVWGPHYINSVRSIVNGTWQPVQAYYHMSEGLVEPTKPSDFVPTEVASSAMDVAAQIRAGTFNIWKGPLTDNHGSVKAPDGKTLGDFLDSATTPAAGQSRDDAYVQSHQMNWALSNILEDLPQGA